ncbi:dehydratase [Virgibacillus sp. NKC19-16]|uniref:MaoC/PaaZ C-terminal domain-containing protein n=1 Tax=Virgibacillus salidurans TaxID=2831673 RepID=UPI001F35FA99|nr:MaoC/PaaZ C-terminal domain-containing protein [Virgibacillus sp. NKC19-16]UJL45491.1 dehydratase [Virgibacillus sp. NKC19-16]
MIDQHYSELKIGESWVSEGRTITESDLVMFSAFSGDWFPLHSNKEYAEKSSFKQRIAHGMLTLSIVTGLMNFNPNTVAAFYGMDQVRFTKPVLIGDTILIHAKIVELNDYNPNQGIVHLKLEIKNQSNENVAVAIMKLMVNKQS